MVTVTVTMMRNLVLIGAILLVSASASVCQFWRKNAVAVLNDYLIKTVASDDLADNMEAIYKYNRGPKDKQVSQLTNLLTNLDKTFEPAHLCSESNLKTLRATFEAVHSYDKESFTKPKVNLRLNGVLYRYFDQAWTDCARFYRDKWASPQNRLVELGLTSHIWTEVDRINRDHAFQSQMNTDDQFLFKGALRLLNGEWEPSGKELIEALDNMQERMQALQTGVRRLTTERVVRTKEEADQAIRLLSKYLYAPCKVLVDDAEAQTILTGPITDLGATVLLTSRYKEALMSLRWAGRSLFCKWALGKSEDQLAKMILE